MTNFWNSIERLSSSWSSRPPQSSPDRGNNRSMDAERQLFQVRPFVRVDKSIALGLYHLGWLWRTYVIVSYWTFGHTEFLFYPLLAPVPTLQILRCYNVL